MTQPAKIAYILMGLALIVFLGTSCVLNYSFSPWVAVLIKVLHHGSEGALVGGICDIIAVRNVYEKAEAQFSSLTQETSDLVVRNLIGVAELTKSTTALEQWLERPEAKEWITEQLETWLPDREDLNDRLDVLWKENLEQQVVQWLLDVDLHELLLGSSKDRSKEGQDDVKPGLLQSKVLRSIFADELEQIADREELADAFVQSVRNVAAALTLADLGIPADPEQMKHLFQELWESWESLGEGGRIKNALAQQVIKYTVLFLAPRIETTTLADLLVPFLSTQRLQIALRRASEKVRQEESNPELPSDLTEALMGYWVAFIDAWMVMEREKKEEVVLEVLNRVQPIVSDVLISTIWSWREQLNDTDALLDHEWVQKLLIQIQKEGEARADSIEQEAYTRLYEQLDGYGSKRFVLMLREKTQEPLDWIKVNGTGYGFVLGSLAGACSLLLGQFF